MIGKVWCKMKKFISLFLTFAILLPVLIVPGAAYNESAKGYDDAIGNFDVVLGRNGNIRTATITDLTNKTVDIMSIDDNTGIVTFNGEFLLQIVNLNHPYSVGTLSVFSEDNWSDPQTTVRSLAWVGYTATAIIGLLSLTYGVPPATAAYIAGLVIGAGGFLYVKAVTQLNYVDYSPKVGYRLTESLHLSPEADDEPLFTRTMTGSR